jgi:hypothetical protein
VVHDAERLLHHLVDRIKDLRHHRKRVVRRADRYIAQHKPVLRLDILGHADFEGREAREAELLAEADDAALGDLDALGHLRDRDIDENPRGCRR